MAKKRKIKVLYKKLGRERVHGNVYLNLHLKNFEDRLEEDYIEIDEMLRGKKHLEILSHEILHFLYPEASEDEIIRKSIVLTNTLWSEGYRRVDNTNKEPLQDGSK